MNFPPILSMQYLPNFQNHIQQPVGSFPPSKLPARPSSVQLMEPHDLYDVESFLSGLERVHNRYPFSKQRVPALNQLDQKGTDPSISQFPKAPMRHSNEGMDIVIDTISLGLLPIELWINHQQISLKQISEQFFKRKSSKKMPFHYKLYNCLKITSKYPEFIPMFGACWVTPEVFKIYRSAFAAMMGIGSINGSLFNKQGSLPTHGFIPVTPQLMVGVPVDISDVDNDNVRLFRHETSFFNMHATQKDLEKCRWKNPRD